MYQSTWRRKQNLFLNQVMMLREVHPHAVDNFQHFHVSEPIWSRDPQDWSSLLDAAQLLVS